MMHLMWDPLLLTPVSHHWRTVQIYLKTDPPLLATEARMVGKRAVRIVLEWIPFCIYPSASLGIHYVHICIVKFTMLYISQVSEVIILSTH